MIQPWTIPAYNGNDLRIGAPYMLLLLIPLVLAGLALGRVESRPSQPLRFSQLGLLLKAGARSGERALRLLRIARIVAIGLLVVAMARPQYGRVERQTWSEGIDIGLVLDVSDSMQTDDFVPNRLEAAKSVLKNFVNGRHGDRVALVIFGTNALTLCPLTLDLGVVGTFIERISPGLIEGKSTAIGMGLATALSKLQDSNAKSKVVILLTDGENNAGKIAPMTAAEAARVAGVRVYTIGVGSDNVMSPFGGRAAGIDEKLLTNMAELTSGTYFRATDNRKLSEIYDKIDQLEKTRIESEKFDNFNDLVAWLAVPALLLLLAESGIRATRYVRVP